MTWACRIVIAMSLSALWGAAAPPARAQPASAQAQSLFDDARKLLKDGKLAEACAAFDASQKLDPAVTTLLNLADCRERNHQLATAWGAFVDANRLARTAGNDKLAKVATSHAKKLEPRLSRLTIAVAADRQVPGLEVLRDSEVVIAASWNHTLPVDGGTYVITARAPGHESWTQRLTVKVEGDRQTVEIPRLEPAAPAPPAVTTAAPASGDLATPSGEPARVDAEPSQPGAATEAGTPAAAALKDPPAAGSRSLVAPIVLGAGAVGLGIASVALKLAGDNKHEDSLIAARMGNPLRAKSLEDEASSRHLAALGVGVVAVGCAGVAIYLMVREPDKPAQATAVVPVVAPSHAGLAVVGRW